MTRQEFFKSLENESTTPPAELSPSLKALWLAQSDQWDAAHDICSDIHTSDGAWIHAYLHRVEGDLGNAAYWYDRAGKPMPPASVSLSSEWQSIIAALI